MGKEMFFFVFFFYFLFLNILTSRKPHSVSVECLEFGRDGMRYEINTGNSE